MSSAKPTQQRPFSADVSHMTKSRLQSSNCPTIVKHEIVSPLETFQPFSNTPGAERSLFPNRPRTATSTKMKLNFLQNMKTAVTPGSVRPMSAVSSTTINFDFLNNINKGGKGKFQDHSKIKPLKKLNIDQFHSVIFKVKQQKEVLEKEINRVEQWHQEIKETDIWSSPQSAIVNSILRLNAQSNPDGNVSRYLQSEREKELFGRTSKKFQRPYSSHASMPRFTPKNPKSVSDFFSPNSDYEHEQVIEEIIEANTNYKSQYSSNKSKITDKMNTYIENMENYNTGLYGNKELIASREHSQKSGKKFSSAIREHSEPIDERNERSFSDIVEDNEGSDIPSQSNLYSKHAHKPFKPMSASANFRPSSAQVQIQTSFSPKDYTTPTTYKPSGSPASIHTRPQTAKFLKPSSSPVIATGLVANGETRQQSISSVKFVPISLEGLKMSVSGKGVFGKENEQGEVRKSKANIPGYRQMKVGDYEMHNIGQKIAGNTVVSTNLYVRPSTGTQTRSFFATEGQHSGKQSTLEMAPNSAKSRVGKLNIDGHYLENFAENRLNSSKGLYGLTTPTQVKLPTDSWNTKETQVCG